MHLCILRGSQNKQRLFLYTILTYRFLKRGRECLQRGTKRVFKSDRYSFVLKGLTEEIYKLPLYKLLRIITDGTVRA